jgi:hypothetical protein
VDCASTSTFLFCALEKHGQEVAAAASCLTSGGPHIRRQRGCGRRRCIERQEATVATSHGRRRAKSDRPWPPSSSSSPGIHRHPRASLIASNLLVSHASISFAISSFLRQLRLHNVCSDLLLRMAQIHVVGSVS